MRHKRRAFTTGIVLAGILLGAWGVPKMIHKRAERELRQFFKGGKVSIGRLSIERPLALGVSEILVDGDGYQLTVEKALIDPALNLTLLRPRVQIRKISSHWQGAKSGSTESVPAMRIQTVHLQDLTVDLRLSGFKGEIHGSVFADMKTSQIRTAHLEAPSFTAGPIKLKKIVLDLPGDGVGVIKAEQMGIGKLKVTDLQGDILWEDTMIRVYPVLASWIRGKAVGRAELLVQDPFDYDAEFEIQDLDLSAFSEEMNLNKKMTAEGKVAGRISMNGAKGGIRFLKGSFASDGGGNLVIRDPNWLKYLAQNTRQPLEIVEAAFKEYHFDTAAASMAASGPDLKFAVRMNGAKGRRDFEVNLHDRLK